MMMARGRHHTCKAQCYCEELLCPNTHQPMHTNLLLLLCGIISVKGFHHPMLLSRHAGCCAHTALHAAAAFDETAYEADRLAKDAQAMDAMKTQAEAEFANLRTPWKWTIRKRIWDLMEAQDIARPPRPVHHRIPNFDGAELAAERLAELPEFQQADCVKVNPDTPQKAVRYRVLDEGKTLLTPQPRLRTGFFSTLRPRRCRPTYPYRMWW